MLKLYTYMEPLTHCDLSGGATTDIFLYLSGTDDTGSKGQI